MIDKRFHLWLSLHLKSNEDINRIEIQLEGAEFGLNENNVRPPLRRSDNEKRQTNDDLNQNPSLKVRDPLTMGDNESALKTSDVGPEAREGQIEGRQKGLGRNVGPYFR